MSGFASEKVQGDHADCNDAAAAGDRLTGVGVVLVPVLSGLAFTHFCLARLARIRGGI